MKTTTSSHTSRSDGKRKPATLAGPPAALLCTDNLSSCVLQVTAFNAENAQPYPPYPPAPASTSFYNFGPQPPSPAPRHGRRLGSHMPEGGTRSKTSDEHLADLREELLHDPDKAKRLEDFLFDAEHLQDAKTPSELQDRLDEMRFNHNATAYRTTDDTDSDPTLDGQGRSLQQIECKPRESDERSY